MKKERKSSNSNKKNFNSIKLGFMSGLGIIIFSIIIVLISGILSTFSVAPLGFTIFENIVIIVLEILFVLGFYSLGKKYNSLFLRVISILIIIFLIISFLGMILLVSPTLTNMMNSITTTASSMNINPQNITVEQQQAFMQALFSNSELIASIGVMIALFLVYIIVTAILSILAGIALIRIGKNVKYAKTAGILEIIGGITAIILIGFIVLLVAFVYELIILNRESKR